MKQLSDYAFSVEYIEEDTKIDIFHNLPDYLEFKLEKEANFTL